MRTSLPAPYRCRRVKPPTTSYRSDSRLSGRDVNRSLCVPERSAPRLCGASWVTAAERGFWRWCWGRWTWRAEGGSSQDGEARAGTHRLLMLIAVGAGGMDSAGRTLVMGDDGSEAADGTWLWINEHDWSGWRIEVVAVDSAALTRGPLGGERVRVHPWQPRSPRVLLTDRARIEVVHLTVDGDPRVVFNRLD